MLKMSSGGLFQNLGACPVKHLGPLAVLQIVLIVEISIPHPISVKEREFPLHIYV